MRRSSAPALAALILSATGCPGCAPDLGPRPEVVEPAFGDPSGATAVVIRGQFRVKTIQDLSTPSGNSVDVTYQAWLDGTPLGQVRWLDEHTLAAVVPAGLSAGLHGLEVQDPAGRRGALADAFFAGIPAVELLSVDPFGNGTRFLQVNGWRGALLVGPDDAARSLAILEPAGGVPVVRGLALPRDTENAGSTSRNTWAGAPPYPSLGSAACVIDSTSACGPDNENARGLFTTATVGGAEWAVAGPVRESGDAHYVYLAAAADDASPLPFRYVDLTTAMGVEADGLTALVSAGHRLYAGFGGTTPQLVVLRATPPPKGLDASGQDAEELGLDLMPGVGRHGTPPNGAPNVVVDALAEFGGLLYVANNGGLVRATVADPKYYQEGEWVACSPSAAAWGAKQSVTTLSTGSLEPRTRAVPALVAWGGRLHAIRNTSSGPQLWVCAPATSPGPAQCDPGDWSLAAPNLSGDPQLSQMNDAGNVRATLLAATAAWLYVGFDNAATGVQIYRTTTATPVNAADFRGEGGCVAGTTGCRGMGGNGLGNPARNTRIQDARALAPPGAAGLYFTTGNGSDPARLYRILD